MFFHRCGYKNRCFDELVHNYNIFVLVICSLKDFISELTLGFIICFEGLLLI